METEKYNLNKTCKSADQVLETYIQGLEVETSHHRVKDQTVKCGFGLNGICCRLCSNGPCRILPDGPRGVCGADADTIVARNFLRAVACGSGCYIHVVENTANILENMGKNFEIFKSEKALHRLGDLFHISENQDIHKLAIEVANAIKADIYKPMSEKMELVKYLSLPKRYEKWQELNILPGGANSEIVNGVVKSSTNLSSDPVDMLIQCLRLGISTGVYGLLLTNLLNDIIMGEPQLQQVPVGLSVVDPDYINIMITGHQESMFHQIMEDIQGSVGEGIAQKAGAKGFRIVGCTCVGQEMQARTSCYKDAFAGHAGNNFTSEAVLATGGIDGVITEFNCTLPGIEQICEKYQIQQICIDSVAKKGNAQLLPYNYEHSKGNSKEILETIAEAYTKRRGVVPLNLVQHGNPNTLSGVTELSLKNFLGDSWQPLIDLIVQGKIKGIVGMVGCSSVAYGHDTLSVGMTKELIKRDILVLTAGCTSGGLANCGLMRPEAADLAGDSLREVCKALNIPPVLNFGPCLAIGRLEVVASELALALNVDLPQLPLAISAAQWLEEQALADGAYGLALGLPLHLGRSPFIGGSKVVEGVLMEHMVDLTGGKLMINADPVQAATELEAVILEKRKALDI